MEEQHIEFGDIFHYVQRTLAYDCVYRGHKSMRASVSAASTADAAAERDRLRQAKDFL